MVDRTSGVGARAPEEGLGALTPDSAAHVRHRANILVFSGSFRSAVTNVLLATLLVVGNPTARASPFVQSWLALLVVVYVVRANWARQFLARPEADQRSASAQWRTKAIAGAWLGGLCWAPGTGLLWNLSHTSGRVLMVMVIAGLLPAATSALASIPTALIGFVVPVWAGTALTLFATASSLEEYVAAICSVFLLPMLIRAGRTMHAEFEASVQMTQEQARLLSELEAARDVALAAASARREFISVMSHELRTPLNGVVGLTSLLLDGRLGDDERELARGARDSAHILLDLINGVLDLSKIDSGRLELEVAEFSANDEVAKLRPIFALRAMEKKLVLRFEVAPEVSERLLGDWFRLRQVLINLVGNALKFTESGEVVCAISAAQAQPGEGQRLHFEVRDTGIGMTPEQLGKLFQPFVQADVTTSRKFGGTGLGLTISKRLVALMGGNLEVHSQEGQGTSFTFDLAFTKASAPAAARDVATHVVSAAHAERVLVCDDNEINLQVASRFVERAGYRATKCRNGIEALERLRSERFDVVLTDLHMPGMDGVEVLHRARSEGLRMPFIALTASASASDREACMNDGFDGFLTKPIDPGQLLTTMASLIAAAEHGTETASSDSRH